MRRYRHVPEGTPRRAVPDELDRVLVAAAGTRHENLWRMALYTSARIGELLAVRWRDVDWDAKTLRIERTLDKRTHTFGPVKTPRSRRILPLGTQAMAVLAAERDWQRGRRERHPESWTHEDLVFAGRFGGAMWYTTLLRETWHRLLDHAGVDRVGIHVLRHTAITAWLLAQVPIPVASRRPRQRGGHGAHLRPRYSRRAAAVH